MCVRRCVYLLQQQIISLDGLLDYDESDKYEATFEVSLFAEIFHEMLQRDFGYYLLQVRTLLLYLPTQLHLLL